MEKRISLFLVQHRMMLSVLSLLLTVMLAVGVKNIYVNNNYNIFFDLDDPQVVDHELHQSIYTKTDNIAFMVHSLEGDIFTASTLALVKNLTEEAWQTPFSIRVDSLTNITSQLPTQHWHDAIGEATLADAILDRLLHNAHKIQLEGESMRKIQSEQNKA
ncbi:MAG: putative RND superfamily exporter protein [Arenicella sp.]|jgi:predicted RND superfamily exporter protein